MQLAAAADFSPGAFSELFKACFDAQLDEAWWRWKYRSARNPSVVLIQERQIVAHYGAMPRRLMMQGRPVAGVQIGDVMVHPTLRAGLGRRGPFFFMVANFLQREVGFNRPSLLAFGFPNLRHLKLGEALGLYAAVDHVTELHWDTGAVSVHPLRRIDPQAADSDALIDGLWRSMEPSLTDRIAGVRDAGWWRERYVQHPTHRYVTWFIGSAEPAAIVVRLHEAALEWVDFFGPLNLLTAGRDAARAVGWAAGKSEVFAWLSSGIAGALRDASAREVDIQVGVPTCVYTPGPPAENVRGRWHLFGGDSDFR